MESNEGVADGTETAKRYRVKLYFEGRSFVVEEPDYNETKIILAKLTRSLLGSALRFDVERVIENDRGICGNFSIEFDKSEAEKVRTVRFGVLACLPDEYSTHGSLALKLEVRA